jgi:hypothetical protein
LWSDGRINERTSEQYFEAAARATRSYNLATLDCALVTRTMRTEVQLQRGSEEDFVTMQDVFSKEIIKAKRRENQMEFEVFIESVGEINMGNGRERIDEVVVDEAVMNF